MSTGVFFGDEDGFGSFTGSPRFGFLSQNVARGDREGGEKPNGTRHVAPKRRSRPQAERPNRATSGPTDTPVLKVHEIMRRNVHSVAPDDCLQKVAAILRDEDLYTLPVCDRGRLVGLITDRNLAIRGIANGVPPATTRVDQIMEGTLFYCFEDQECEVARRVMLENRLDRLPVTNSRKQLVGMVTLGDLS